MKILRIPFLLCGFVAATVLAQEDGALPTTITVGDTTYSNVTWRTVTPATVSIFHRSGVASIPLESLPPDLQERFGYNPTKAAAYRSALENAETARREALQQRRAEEEAARLQQAKEAAQSQVQKLQQYEPAKITTRQFAPAFVARTTAGQTIRFPDDYRGKVVLLDFWATWCGPCVREMPNVVSAYRQFHSKGFEVLGISLDREQDRAKLAQFTRDNNISWPQIYDGKFWKAELAVKYDVHSIPRPILVDGDTGVILAQGAAARDRTLAPAIEKALAAKARK